MKRFEDPIFVTRPFFPDIGEFKGMCEEIWRNQWLSNNGPLVQRFQSELAKYLNVQESNLALFNNGTLALELGFYALGLAGGEVITTPFTFVATSHALRRIGAIPVFADIDPETACLSPQSVEKLIKPGITRAVVPVHVYGHSCDVEGFARLKEKYGVKIIYDAAHAFGVELGGKSIAYYGDMSMFSFHPTKLFHSCEGGLLVFKDTTLQRKLHDLRNFAIHSEIECVDVGTNAKMNELQAAMGLLCLKELPGILSWRRKIHETYRKSFSNWTSAKYPDLSLNCAYCPILFKDFETRERVYRVLKNDCNVYARRYFYPLLTDFSPYSDSKGTCPVAEDIASRVLTLPTYYGLDESDVEEIAANVKEIAG